MDVQGWPVFALLGTVLGTLLQTFAGSVGLAVVLAAASAGGLLARTRWQNLLAVAAAFVLLSYGRSLWCERALGADPYRDKDGLAVDVSGTVLESPRSLGLGVGFRFQLERVEGRPELPAARVYVRLHDDSALPALGERWRLVGRLAAPDRAAYPGAFDQAEGLKRDGIHHSLLVSRGGWQRLGPPPGLTLRSLAQRARLWLADSLAGRLEPSEHALLMGIMLGEDRGLDAATREAFRATGTSHLLAASGLNVGIVVGLVFLLGHRAGFGRHRVVPIALLAVVFYTFLAGCSPSIVRAATMASLGLIALALGRETAPSRCLVIACLGALWMRPGYLFDVGFQMSALAVAGILLFSPGLERRLGFLPGFVRTSLAVTTAATLALLPILLGCFQQLSPVSLVANLVMSPPAELLLPLGLLTGVLAGCLPAAAAPLIGLCHLLLEFLMGSARMFASWGGSAWIPRPTWLELGGLLLGLWWLWSWLSGAGRPALAGLALLMAVAGFIRPSGAPCVRVVDLAGRTVVWFHGRRGEALLLEEEGQEKSALRMLRQCGGARPLLVSVHPFSRRVVALGDDLHLRLRPGWARFSCRGASFTWCLSPEGSPPPRGGRKGVVEGSPPPTTVLLDRGRQATVSCQLRIPQRGGPWEIRLGPDRVRWYLWE